MTTTPHLHALAMRTAAAAHCNDRADSRDSTPKQGMAYRSAARHILALPLEADHAALLAEAVKLPEIAALMDFVNADRELRMIGILNATEDQMKVLINARQKAHDTLSALETP